MKVKAMFVLLVALPLLAQSAEEKGLDLAKRIDAANAGFVGEYAEMEMVLINAHGDETVRKIVTYTKEMDDDGDRTLSTFQWPADVKGTHMLTWSHKDGDDDQWLYLPALKRVKRISSRNKSGAFMGSEFSYEDLGSQEVEEYTYKYLEETDLDGRKTWLLERDPVSEKSGYSKEVVWYDQEMMNPLRVDYYDRKGELLKTSVFEDYEQFGEFWRVGSITCKNVQTKKKSIIRWNLRKLGETYDAYFFSSDNLVE